MTHPPWLQIWTSNIKPAEKYTKKLTISIFSPYFPLITLANPIVFVVTFHCLQLYSVFLSLAVTGITGVTDEKFSSLRVLLPRSSFTCYKAPHKRLTKRHTNASQSATQTPQKKEKRSSFGLVCRSRQYRCVPAHNCQWQIRKKGSTARKILHHATGFAVTVFLLFLAPVTLACCK